MPDPPAKRVTQDVRAGRDAFVAGRDQFVTIYAGGTSEPAVPGLLPRDVPGFTGRKGELGRLAALAGRGSVIVTAISGTAGVGKTALAVHAAHLLLPQFPDGQLYADLRGYSERQAPADPGEVLAVFLRRLRVPTDEMPSGVEEQAGVLRGLLASRRVLMLLDNAASEAQVRPLLPGAGGSLVLVTSRTVLPGLEADERISLDVLADNEAMALLAGLIGPVRTAAEPESMQQVRQYCGDLPLALRIAGQILAAHPAWPVARLADMLADQRDRLHRLAAGDLQLLAAFTLSYRHLPDKGARIFRLLGLHPGPDFDAAAAASLAGTVPETARTVLGKLAEACLLTEDDRGRFEMHDLLRLFARDTCLETDAQTTRDDAETRLLGYYADLAGFLDSCRDPAAAQAAGRPGVPLPSAEEALAIFEAELPNLLAAVDLAARRGQDELLAQLSERTQSTLQELGYLVEQITIREALSWRQFEKDIRRYEESLAISREAGDQHGEARILGALGFTHRELGLLEPPRFARVRFEEAARCYERVLAIVRDTGGPPGEADVLADLGFSYAHAGRLEEAARCYEQALAISREPGGLLAEVQIVRNLGDTYLKLRRFEDAIRCYEQWLAIYQETGHRYGGGEILSSLGDTYLKLRRFEEAARCYERWLAIGRETGGLALWVLRNLGDTYLELQRFEEAARCYERWLAIQGDPLPIGEERISRFSEGEVLSGLGNAYRGLRQLDRATACWQDAAAAMRDAGEPEMAGRMEQLAAGSPSRRRRRKRS